MKERRKSSLDEMQELELLRIESRGYKIALWGLVAEIVVQELMGTQGTWLGECLVLAVMCGYVCTASARRGIWDRYLKPDWKTNALLSLIAGLIVGAPLFGVTFWRYHSLPGSLAAAVIAGGFTFFLAFTAESVVARYTLRRRKELEAEPDDE